MSHPISIFAENWEKARALNDANAHYCSLGTVSATGQASIRTLVLREVTDDSFVIFINETSPKWQDLLNSGQFELLVFWPSLMQQYRIRGQYSELPVSTMKNHWARKPYDSKILDHFYTDYQRQSSGIASREAIVKGIDELKQRYSGSEEVPFPENAKGVAVKASYIEVWHSSASDRLHDRSLYLLRDAEWVQHTLVP